ncbi:MAG: hypothetical protein IKX47_05080 [Oscillospiraceae bacterium]|nr:hypothetical protein [Oscillospiraceae bacterium]
MTREVRTLADRDRKVPEKITAEEWERRLKDAFFCPDQIDDTVSRELEAILEALEELQPSLNEPDPEESWQQFLSDRAAELDEIFAAEIRRGEKPRTRPVSTRTAPKLLRRALIAAVVVVLLAGAALAADSLGLVAWVPKWNVISGRFEPTAQEGVPERPIPAALAELSITEQVYPAYLPKGFVITESRISEDPLVLMEQYARGDRIFSITVTPVKGFQLAVYQQSGEIFRVQRTDSTVHYLFRNEGTITAVRYTEHYATSISGNVSLEEIESIMDSLPAASEGGSQT